MSICWTLRQEQRKAGCHLRFRTVLKLLNVVYGVSRGFILFVSLQFSKVSVHTLLCLHCQNEIRGFSAGSPSPQGRGESSASPPAGGEGAIARIKLVGFIAFLFQSFCIKTKSQGWRGGLAVKSTDCPSRGPEFNSQHPHMNLIVICNFSSC